jgi:hypothetical protein
MRIGFTGTRKGMTDAQRKTVAALLRQQEPEVAFHGDCVGADAEFHALCRALEPAPVINIRPGCERGDPRRAGCAGDVTATVRPFLQRNRDIVDACQMLIVAPGEDVEHKRSGTWSTYRYAKTVGRELVVVFPDGRKEFRA